MGIRNLLPHIRHKFVPTNIKDIKGKVGVDVSCFIYRAIYAGVPVNIYIQKLVNILVQNEIEVFLVFDGFPYKEKRETLNLRRARISKDDVSEAKGVKNCKILQAPMEADSYLADLSLKGEVDYVITIDSDLIVYGCEKILYHFKSNGDCLLYDKSILPSCFPDFDFNKFRWLCILAGCDYVVGGLKGMGIKTGWNLLKNYDSLKDFLEYREVPAEKIEDFIRADNIFTFSI